MSHLTAMNHDVATQLCIFLFSGGLIAPHLRLRLADLFFGLFPFLVLWLN